MTTPTPKCAECSDTRAIYKSRDERYVCHACLPKGLSWDATQRLAHIVFGRTPSDSNPRKAWAWSANRAVELYAQIGRESEAYFGVKLAI